MSEIVQPSVKPHRSRILILVAAVLSILLLVLVYGAGIMTLPTFILVKYQSRDCDSTLTLNKVYTSLYPKFLEDGALLAPVQECETYVLAVSKQAEGSWREAYDVYQAYALAYPNGLYAIEAHQQSAGALLNLAQDQVEQKNYEEALTNLNLIVANYSDTGVINNAWDFYPSVYTPWGVSLREAGDYAKSEQVLDEFKTWSLTNQKSDFATDAQRELAQTYLAWGLELQSQTQFEEAIVKFELAASADPEAQFDSAAQVKAGQSSAYIGWGNDLLEEEQFAVAIEKFELAISKSDDTNAEGAQDALANGQIQWAGHLSVEEDFHGALEHLESAREAAASEAMKKSVEAAQQDTHLAFSKSTGSQARQAMQEVLETACEEQEAPTLPIFGLNKDSIRFGIYGVDDKLPASLAAKTPGEMHYIACITPDNKTVETRLHKSLVLDFGRYDFYTLVEQFRVQVNWNIDLQKTDTGERVAEETLKGELPPPFSETGGNYFYGPTPMEEFMLWLQSFLQ